MQEVWRSVKDYESYEVSSFGRVRRNGRMLKPWFVFSSRNYYGISLYRSWRKQHAVRTIHSMVMAAFVGPRPKGHEINHKDGIKTNNRLDNLEYVTPQENIRHAFRMGLHGDRKCKPNRRSKFTVAQWKQIAREYEEGSESLAEVGKRWNVGRCYVWMIVNRSRRQNWGGGAEEPLNNGYRWRTANHPTEFQHESEDKQ